MNEMEAGELAKYFFELGQLSYVKNAGWWVAKVKDPASVAEHSFKTAVIAYVLAKLERHPEPEKIAVKALLHDAHETRLLDRHKISTAYFRTPGSVVEKIKKDQCSRLPEPVRGDLLELLGGEEGDLVKDAGYLEYSVTGKEYFDLGYQDAWDWIERSGKVLKTKTAKQLHAKISKMDSGAWWRGLKESVEELKY